MDGLGRRSQNSSPAAKRKQFRMLQRQFDRTEASHGQAGHRPVRARSEAIGNLVSTSATEVAARYAVILVALLRMVGRVGVVATRRRRA